MHVTHSLKSGVYILLFVLLSDLSSMASPHILWFVCVADGTILLYILVDLLSKIERTFLSADKCTRTYNGVISIAGVILDKTQGCLLVDLLVSICVLCGLPYASLLWSSKRSSCYYWQDYLELNMKHSRKIDIFCWICSCSTSWCSYLLNQVSPQMLGRENARYSECGKIANARKTR